MRVIMLLLALVAMPLVASAAQGQNRNGQSGQQGGNKARKATPARPAAPAAAAARSQNQNCDQQEGQHQGNNSCDDPVPPPPPPAPPPPPPTASCSGLVAPSGDVSVTGGVFRGSAGLAGWCVQLFSNGVVVGDSKTDASGAYAFNSIAAGTYLVCLVVQSGFTQTFPTAMPGDPLCAGNVAGYPMMLPPMSSSPFNDFVVQ